MTMKPTLLDMPKLLMNKILEDLNFREIEPLWKVCRHLRNFIDDQKPDSRLRVVTVGGHSSGNYRIHYDVNFHTMPNTHIDVFYQKHKKGCLLKCEGKEKFLENENFLLRSLKDLEVILKNQKTSLGLLRFDRNNRNWEDRSTRIWEIFRKKLDFSLILDTVETNILKSRDVRLKTKGLMIESNNHEEILKILPYLDPNFLTSLNIFNCLKTGNHLKMEQLLELEHFKNLERLTISDSFVPNSSIPRFAHIPHCDIEVESLSSNEMMALKEILLHTPTFEDFTIKFHKFPDIHEFCQAIGIVDLDVTDHRRMFMGSTNFRIPNSEYIIGVNLTYMDAKQICFRRFHRPTI